MNSSPSAAGFHIGGVSRAAKGADCKSAGFAFVGSSPTSPTILGKTNEGGCSSMVEQQPSKLMTRVRFPSPAPVFAAQQRRLSRRSAKRKGGQPHIAQLRLGRPVFDSNEQILRLVTI